MSQPRKAKSAGGSLELFAESAATSAARKRSLPPDSRLPSGLKPKQYELDDGDGMVREIVGPWARDKHARLERYIDIAKSVRRNWVKKGPAGATYIDLYSGPARVRIKATDEVLHGSPLAAWECSIRCKAPFTQVYVADAHPAIRAAAETRLRQVGAPVEAYTGKAEESVDTIVARLDKYSLHFAFLDPFDLKSLPFDVIRKLAQLQRMDILIHFSTHDLNRNLRKYADKPGSALDTFAPGWRKHVDLDRSDQYVRAKIFAHWRSLLKTVGMNTAEAAVLVSGLNRQPLYWLAFAARHDLALKFWDAIKDLTPQTAPGVLTAKD